jgi:hypothetical protein
MQLTLERTSQQFYELLEKIDTGIIQQCDGFMVREPNVKILKHYFTYAGKDANGVRWFFITMSSIGNVKLMSDDELFELALKYSFSLEKVIPFVGNNREREAAYQRGLSCIGKPYSWIGKNCENLMNYIQTGKSKSIQTRTFSGGVALVGGVMMNSKNKAIRKAGGGVAVVGLFALIIDLFNENKF